MHSRYLPDVRRRKILDAAIKEAHNVGYQRFTREAVAARADCVPGLIGHYFKSIEDLRREVMRVAVKRAYLRIVAQGIGNRDPVALKAPASVKRQAIEILADA